MHGSHRHYNGFTKHQFFFPYKTLCFMVLVSLSFCLRLSAWELLVLFTEKQNWLLYCCGFCCFSFINLFNRPKPCVILLHSIHFLLCSRESVLLQYLIF